jgi:hypothetical protein
VVYLNYLSVSPGVASNETGKPWQTITLSYPSRSIAVGNDARTNQVRRSPGGILERTPAPVKRLMFAEVGGCGGRRLLVLLLDTVDKLVIVGAIVNELLGARVVFAGRVAVDRLAIVGAIMNELLGARVVFAVKVAVGE